MKSMKRFLPLLPLSLTALAAAAGDPLADLRARLQSLKAAAPFAARIEIRESSRNDDEGARSDQEKTASVEARHDAGGVQLRWDRAAIEKARRDAAAAERDPDAAKHGGLAGLNADAALDLLDRAPKLLLDLEEATLIGSRADEYGGRPATRLTISPRVAMSRRQRKHVKKLDATLTLWLDGEGWPLAAEWVTHLKGSFMLVGFAVDDDEKTIFARAADRLYAASVVREGSGSGFGQQGRDRKTVTLTPLGGQAGDAAAARAGSWMK